MVPVHASKVDF